MRQIDVQCPRCGAHMGRLIEQGNIVYLDAGGWLIKEGKKRCHACGFNFMFLPPRVSFETLLERAKPKEGGLVMM